MVTTKLATAAALAALPDDGYKYYLLRGEIRRMSPAKINHGIIASKMAFPLFELAAEQDVGVVVIADAGFRLGHNPDTVLAPDAAFILNEDLPPPGERDFTTHICVPTVAIEVVSPTNTRREVIEKIDAYRAAGVKLIWVAFPETKSILVDGAGREPVILIENDTLDGGDVLPTLRPVRVTDLFR